MLIHAYIFNHFQIQHPFISILKALNLTRAMNSSLEEVQKAPTSRLSPQRPDIVGSSPPCTQSRAAIAP